MGYRSMSFYQCDVCETRSPGFDAAIYTRVDVWQILHAEGWTRRKLSSDMGMKCKCPECGTSQPNTKAAV